jgi:ParB/RepB/Spo0J family partition protein
MPVPDLEPARELPIDAIVRDPDQPRRSITPEDLADLVLSIRAHGVINPVLVSAIPGRDLSHPAPYMLVSGERRWAAARLAGLRYIPANLQDRTLGPADRLMVQLEENDGELRLELPLADRVDAVLRAFKLSGLRKDEFAAAHGKSPGWLSHYLALATADGITQAALLEGHLTGMTAARLFIRLGSPDRIELLDRARRNRLPITDRLIEAAAQRHERDLAGGPLAPGGPAPITFSFSLHQLAKLLALLGQEPAPTPEEQLRQLRTLLDQIR